MFLGITNTPRDYAWGSRTAIGELLGHPTSGGPEAELWLGAHPEAPAVVTDATPAYAGQRLDALIADRPDAFVGAGRTRLPFLMKVLAADEALSLQAHPDDAQARAGFARERDARTKDADRNYKDDSGKPELILALSPTFEALAGFRHLSEARMLLAELRVAAQGDERAALDGFGDRLAAGDPATAGATGSSAHVIDDGMPDEAETIPHHTASGNALEGIVEWLLRGGDDVSRLVDAVVAVSGRMPDTSSFAREWRTVVELAEEHPGDPGVALSLLLNRISLKQGQSLALAPGGMHAYLQGLGIEVMSASDNVLRGGLTGKRVDVDELLRVVDFTAAAPEISVGDPMAPGLTAFRGTTDDFVLAQVALGESAAEHGYRLAGARQTAFDLTGPAVILCLDGVVTVRGRQGDIALARGDAALATPDEGTLTFEGSALAYVATTP